MSVQRSFTSLTNSGSTTYLRNRYPTCSGIGHGDEDEVVRATYQFAQTGRRIGQMPERGPVPDKIKRAIGKRQARPLFHLFEIRCQCQLFPDTLDAGQPLCVVIDKRYRAFKARQRHAIDAADSSHAIARGFEHTLETIAAFEIEQKVVKDKALVNQAKAFVIVCKVFFPGGSVRHE